MSKKNDDIAVCCYYMFISCRLFFAVQINDRYYIAKCQ